MEVLPPTGYAEEHLPRDQPAAEGTQPLHRSPARPRPAADRLLLRHDLRPQLARRVSARNARLLTGLRLRRRQGRLGSRGAPLRRNARRPPDRSRRCGPRGADRALDDDLAAVRKRVRASSFETCIVIDNEQIVLGRLGRAAIHSDEQMRVEQAMSEGPSTVRPSLPLRELIARMAQRNQTTALVTTLDGQLVGLVRREEAQRVLTA